MTTTPKAAPVIETGPHTAGAVWTVAATSALTVASVAVLVVIALLHQWDSWVCPVEIGGLVISVAILVLAITGAEDERREARRQEDALLAAFADRNKKTRASRREIATLRRLLADAVQRDETKSKRAKK